MKNLIRNSFQRKCNAEKFVFFTVMEMLLNQDVYLRSGEELQLLNKLRPFELWALIRLTTPEIFLDNLASFEVMAAKRKNILNS